MAEKGNAITTIAETAVGAAAAAPPVMTTITETVTSKTSHVADLVTDKFVVHAVDTVIDDAAERRRTASTEPEEPAEEPTDATTGATDGD